MPGRDFNQLGKCVWNQVHTTYATNLIPFNIFIVKLAGVMHFGMLQVSYNILEYVPG